MADDEYTPEMLAMLERQRAYFAREALVERAAEMRGATPAECWAATVELCAGLDWFLARMTPETRARALAPEPLSDELVAILEALQRAA